MYGTLDPAIRLIILKALCDTHCEVGAPPIIL
jgi:hypothetical protein